jgi:hypothetical protein
MAFLDWWIKKDCKHDDDDHDDDDEEQLVDE